MPSEPLKLSELQNQLAIAKTERPGLDRLKELRDRFELGHTKIEAAKATGANGKQLKDAEKRLEALAQELVAKARAELRWYVLDVTHSIWQDFHERFCTVAPDARLALIVPGVVEVKVRLDGTDDVPF